ncbi:Protein of unknown function [Gryllus bimaculatus]|nr:Protein of unknown function [Gryllus bimaculatus]
MGSAEMSEHSGLPTRNICFQDRLSTGFRLKLRGAAPGGGKAAISQIGNKGPPQTAAARTRAGSDGGGGRQVPPGAERRHGGEDVVISIAVKERQDNSFDELVFNSLFDNRNTIEQLFLRYNERWSKSNDISRASRSNTSCEDAACACASATCTAVALARRSGAACSLAAARSSADAFAAQRSPRTPAIADTSVAGCAQLILTSRAQRARGEGGEGGGGTLGDKRRAAPRDDLRGEGRPSPSPTPPGRPVGAPARLHHAPPRHAKPAAAVAAA